MSVSVKKKITLALVVNLLLLCGIEASVRFRAVLLSGNQGPLWYGGEFARKILRDDSTLADAFPAEDITSQEQAADEAFLARQELFSVPLRSQAATEVLVAGVPVRRNNHGFRGPDFDVHKLTGVRRIVTAGASFVFGWGVRDHETWAALMQHYLDEREGRFEVINAGRGGTNIHDVLQTMVRTVVQLSPDVVILFSAYNNHALLEQSPRLSTIQLFNDYLYNLSLAYVTVVEKLALSRGQPNDYLIYNRQVSVDPDKVEQLMETYQRRLEQIVTLCSENGIRVWCEKAAEVQKVKHRGGEWLVVSRISKHCGVYRG